MIRINCRAILYFTSLAVLIAAMSFIASPSMAHHCKGGHASDPACPPPAPTLQDQIDNLQAQIDGLNGVSGHRIQVQICDDQASTTTPLPDLLRDPATVFPSYARPYVCWASCSEGEVVVGGGHSSLDAPPKPAGYNGPSISIDGTPIQSWVVMTEAGLSREVYAICAAAAPPPP